MNRVCLAKATGKLIEMQSSGEHENPDIMAARLNTLWVNAIRAGYEESEIEVKWVTDEEFAEIQQANQQVPTYQKLRKPEYPPAGEYLDGIVKGDTAQIEEYIQDCLAVKAKYPK